MIRNFAITATSLTVLLFAAAQSPAQMQMNAVTSAASATSHLALAQQYHAQAREFATQANVHADMLAAYKADVTRTNNKNQATTIGHCETLIEEYQQKAAAAEKLAEAQEELAQVEQPAAPQTMSGMQMPGAKSAGDAPAAKKDDMAGMKMSCCDSKSAAKSDSMPGMDMTTPAQPAAKSEGMMCMQMGKTDAAKKDDMANMKMDCCGDKSSANSSGMQTGSDQKQDGCCGKK